jgi:hypothetical protein
MTSGGMKFPSPSNLVRFPGKARTPTSPVPSTLSGTAVFVRRDMRELGARSTEEYAEVCGTTGRSVRRIRARRVDTWEARRMLAKIAELEAALSEAQQRRAA